MEPRINQTAYGSRGVILTYLSVDSLPYVLELLVCDAGEYVGQRVRLWRFKQRQIRQETNTSFNERGESTRGPSGSGDECVPASGGHAL